MNTPAPAPARHAYVSTACLHGLHEACGQTQRARGDDGPPRCKFCAEVCLCPTCWHQGRQLPPTRARAFYRAYPHGSGLRSERVTRLHILREDGGPFRGTHRAQPAVAVRQGWCGTSAGPHRQSNPVILDPMPAAPPAGLSWCPPCIGRLAATAGCLDGVAALLAGLAAA